MRSRLSLLGALVVAVALAAAAHASPFVSIYTLVGPAELKGPGGLAAAPDGTIVVADTINQRIRRISPSGRVTTIAGTGDNGFSGDGGPAMQAEFEDPTAVALGRDGSVYVCDTGNNRIRVIRPDGTVATVAGTSEQGFSGDGGPATSAQLNAPAGIAVDQLGRVFFSDTGNNRIRAIGSDGRIATLLGSPLKAPTGLSFMANGTLLIADTGNNAVEKLSPDGQLVRPTTGLRMPVDVAAAPDGGFYIAEQGGNQVRRVDSTGRLGPFAGTRDPRFGGDGNAASAAYLNAPHAIEFLNSGLELVVADTDNDRLRYVTSSDHASRLAVAAPQTLVTAPLFNQKITVKKRKRRILVVRDIALKLRLSTRAQLTMKIRTMKSGRLVATLKKAGGPDIVAVHLPAWLRSGAHRLKKDHYVVGVTAKTGSASAATSWELVVK